MELTPTIVNVAVFGVILVSAMLAYARGLTREAVTLAVWLGAALIALNFYPAIEPHVRNFKDMGEWTKWVAVGATFVIALILFTLIGGAIASLIANSPLRAIDKGLGFLFGAARGLLILAISWIGYQQIVKPEYTHESIEASKGGQLVVDSSEYLMTWAPTEWPDFIKEAAVDLMEPNETDTPPTIPASTESAKES